MPLKKPNRDRARQIPDPRISGRGAFSDTNHRNFWVVQEGQHTNREVFSRAFQDIVQWICYS